MKQNVKDKTNRSFFPDGSTLPERKNAGNVTGVVKVHESVISAIIRKAALSVDGVCRLAGNSLVDNIAEIVGSRKVMDRSISVEMQGNSVAIELKIILAYGCCIPEVARNIQTTVIDEIVRISGMQVTRIDILVMDLEDAAPEEEPDTVTE
ncbi:MAG: Asp23/Gls24 family envelope stress response protein [Lentisphaeria bacterium]|nr:Asp23/Gls24 family envelope stress response protein [Lentisphaeria bacterium]